jgi:hypothetical protein
MAKRVSKVTTEYVDIEDGKVVGRWVVKEKHPNEFTMTGALYWRKRPSLGYATILLFMGLVCLTLSIVYWGHGVWIADTIIGVVAIAIFIQTLVARRRWADVER